MRILQASFFWRNDRSDGLGLTFGPNGFSPDELTAMFFGETIRQYMRDSDAMLGSKIVDEYLAQLAAIAQDAKRGPLPLHMALLAAMNIIYLTDRGFLAQDEFNGTQFVQTN